MASAPLLQVYRSRRMSALVGLGFAAGLPYILLTDTLTAWLSDARVDVKSIGLFSLIALPYALKFLWSPLLDRFVPPGLGWLGRRRGWLALSQALLAMTLVALALTGADLGGGLRLVAILGVLMAILSASQDIAADAYRTDVLQERELGAGAAVYVAGYRVAMIVGGAFTLILAGRIGWSAAFGLMAILMGGAVMVTLLAPTSPYERAAPASLREAVVQPVSQFVRSRGWAALGIIAFVLVFRLPDHLASRMTLPLLLQHLEFALADVGYLRQMLGFFLTILGALFGGALVARLGLMRSLILFGVLQALSNAGFLLLASVPPNLMLMASVIGVESFCGGLVAAGFVAFLMSCCDHRYTATQYALLSGAMAAGHSFSGAITGYLVAGLGYFTFFLVTILAAAPGLLLLLWLRGDLTVRRKPLQEVLSIDESPAARLSNP